MTETEILLCCLAEECAEVAQRVSKALRFGLSEVQPGQPYNNAVRISVELTDMCAVMEMLEEAGALPQVHTADIQEAALAAKKSKVRAYLEYSMGRAPHPHSTRHAQNPINEEKL